MADYRRSDCGLLALCVESSHARGMGHLFRALNLADGMRLRGWSFVFLINAHEPALALLAEHGHRYEVVGLDNGTDWEQEAIQRLGIRIWIDDRLNTDLGHGHAVKAAGVPWVTFDDRGPGAALADLNIAALVFEEPASLPGRRVLQGPDYLILNPEIACFQRVRKDVQSLVVTMGGSDTYGVTVEVVKKLAASGRRATIIVGPGFAHWTGLEAVLTPDFLVRCGVSSLIAEFSRHDLAITGGGVTPFEAAASGLPCIVIANEDFEVPVGKALEGLGVARFAGHYAAVDWASLDETMAVEPMSRAGLARIGLGGRERVLDAIGAFRDGDKWPRPQ